MEGKELSLTKVKRKALQDLLTSKQIYNEVNPTAEEKEANSFKIQSLSFPLFFLAIALVIEYFTHNKETLHRVLFIAVPCFIAGGSLYGMLTKHVRFLRNVRKLSIGLVLIMIVLVLGISQLLYGVRF